MKALDAVMSLFPGRRRGRHEVQRYTLSDYFGWVAQSMTFNGHTYPVGQSHGVTTSYGRTPAEPIGNSFEGYATGLLYSDGPVASAEAFRLRVFGQAPPLFQTRQDNGRPGDLYDDDSLDLLRHPWTGGNCSDLMKRALIHGDLGGNAYIVVLDGDLVLLRPDWVEIILAPRMYEGYQVGFKQVGIAYYEGGLGQTSDPAVFVPGEYVHFVPGLPDPLATYRGMSWLTPVIREVMSDKAASDHKLKFFENAATPNLAVSLPKEVTPAQFNAFVDKMDATHKGGDNAYKTLYTGGGADVTVIGADMRQMDFGNVQGKIETRIANAAGVPPVLLSFSEGMQGSSLNAGNYTPAKRNFVDTTGRDLWANWYGSLEVLFPPPKPKDRLTYDPRDIPFLHEDQTDVAQIKQIEAATMNTLVTAGWEKSSIIAATVAGDWTMLKDTGLVSVQLLPPGTTAAPEPKAAARSVMRKFDPDQPRIPAGHEGGGRWGGIAGLLDFDALESLYGELVDERSVGDFTVSYYDSGDMTLSVDYPEGRLILADGFDQANTTRLADGLEWAASADPDGDEAIDETGLVDYDEFTDSGVIVGYDPSGDVRISSPAGNDDELHEYDVSPDEANDLAEALRDMWDANQENQDSDVEEERSVRRAAPPKRRLKRVPRRVPQSRYRKKKPKEVAGG